MQETQRNAHKKERFTSSVFVFYFIGILFLVAFIVLAMPLFQDNSYHYSFDYTIQHAILSLRPEGINANMNNCELSLLSTIISYISFLGEGLLVIIVTASLFVVSCAKGRFKEGFEICFGFGFFFVVGYAIKYIVNRARPVSINLIELPDSASFISGHSFNVIVFFLLATFVLYRLYASGYLRHNVSIPFSIISVLLILIIAFSRIYLGVHWPSDVFGGLCLGAACLGFTLGTYVLIFGRPQKLRGRRFK